MFGKNSYSGFGKNLGHKLIGAAKGMAHILDEPLVHSAISFAAPEVGAAIAGAKKFGLLERVKRI